MKIPNHLLEENVAVKASTRKQVNFLYALMYPGKSPRSSWYRYSINTVVYLGEACYGNLSYAELKGHTLHPFEAVLSKPLIRRKV